MNKLWYDRLGREIRADNKGFDGTMIYNVTKYNLKGQVDSISDPYYSTGNALWNRYVYDYYGRNKSIQAIEKYNMDLYKQHNNQKPPLEIILKDSCLRWDPYFSYRCGRNNNLYLLS